MSKEAKHSFQSVVLSVGLKMSMGSLKGNGLNFITPKRYVYSGNIRHAHYWSDWIVAPLTYLWSHKRTISLKDMRRYCNALFKSMEIE